MGNRTRSKRVQVRLTDDEYDFFVYNVERTGMTKEAYLRTLILNRVPKTREARAESRNIAAQLYAIGNNLNQIARVAHSVRVINAERYDEAVEDFKKIMTDFLKAEAGEINGDNKKI